MPSTQDYYAVLGLSREADPDVIRAAFRALAKKHHPDVNAAASSARFREINEAYSVLIDPEKRAAYDRATLASDEAVPPTRPNRAPPPPAPPPPPTETRVDRLQRQAAATGAALIAITLVFGLLAAVLGGVMGK